jgi:hypothetical protein
VVNTYNAMQFDLWNNYLVPLLIEIGFMHLGDMKVLGTEHQVIELILTQDTISENYKNIKISVKKYGKYLTIDNTNKKWY